MNLKSTYKIILNAGIHPSAVFITWLSATIFSIKLAAHVPLLQLFRSVLLQI